MASRRRSPRRSSLGNSPIRIKPGNKGKLRKAAGAKKGQKVPVAKLRELKKSRDPKTRRRATFALNARSWGKGGKS